MKNRPLATDLATSRSKKRGFTLTEIAIVLGIIGLILGAIWTASSSVYNNQRINNTQRDVLSIAQGLRSLYATQNNFGAAGTNLTAAMAVSAKAPPDIVSSAAPTVINNRWNGNSGVKSGNGLLFITSDQISVAGDSFTITLSYIPGSACTSLLTLLSTVTGYSNYQITAATAAVASGATAPTAPAAAITAAGTEGAGVGAAAAQTACGTAFDALSMRFTK